MVNYAKVYDDVLIDEVPSIIQKYALCEIQIAELPEQLEGRNDPLKFPFKHSFAQGTTKYVNYTNSPEYMEALKLLCQSVKRKDIAH